MLIGGMAVEQFIFREDVNPKRANAALEVLIQKPLMRPLCAYPDRKLSESSSDRFASFAYRCCGRSWADGCADK